MKKRERYVRSSLKEENFYEDVTFANQTVEKNVRNTVENWKKNLRKFREIEINKFKDLFSQFKEIVFPIKIQASYLKNNVEIEFVDNDEKKYCMSARRIYDYYEMTYYIIRRRNSILEPLIDREFNYIICEDGTIKLVETSAMRLKKDGTNDDILVVFSYNLEKTTTEARLKSYSSKKIIIIKYPTKNNEFDKKVLTFLFSIDESTYYYYNVFFILKWFKTEICDENLTISITAEVYGEIFSEVEVENEIVKRYTTTKIISEEEMITTRKIFAKDLKEFLAQNS